ncbi:MAG: ABC transporter substrate-binding protein [Bacillales bacterium]|nr:ABC transporter substrate-binding protein [Bacillales bacterium]
MNCINEKGSCPKKATSLIHKTVFFLLFILLSISLTACNKTTTSISSGSISITDSLGNNISFEETPQRVVALQGSFAAVYLLSGGELVGITSDYVNYDLDLGNATIVGTNKAPNTELIISLNPDLIIYTPTLTGQTAAAETLSSAGFKVYASVIDGFNDYLYTLLQFTTLNNRSDLYTINGVNVENQINNIIADVPNSGNPDVLFIRAYSNGYEAKSTDNIVCDMLDDLKVNNIAKSDSSLLENISLEAIVEKDPDYILFVYMGSSDIDATTAYLNNELFSQPSWQNLKAYKNGNVIILPANLFHYKPNNKWGEAYEYLFNIFYKEDNQ